VVPNQQQLGTGCLISDPFFTGPDAGDYSLSTESPCIDTGDPDSPKDSDSTRADMGASSLVTRITVAVNDARRLPPRAELLPNAPNPFNPATTIRFNMPRGDNVRVAIYNVQGQLVRSVVNGWKHAGVHHTTWNGTDASGRSAASGVYLCYMTTSSGSQARRMILLR